MGKEMNGGAVKEYVKGEVVAIIFTLLFILFFAILIKFCNIDSKYIVIVNQAIKSLSITLAMLICFTCRPNGWLRGFFFGIIYIVTAFIVFSAFNSSFVLDIKLLNDCVLGGITGLIDGIIVVNVKKERV